MSLFIKRLNGRTSVGPVEGHLPGYEGATGWLNSTPLTAADLQGKVVLTSFWTYTCINWLRTLGYFRAWAEKYKDRGMLAVGVHTPEFPFERSSENVVVAARELDVQYTIALDSDYAVWEAFGNRYWPALYIADAEGRIRHHQFGEGGYDECERIIQQLLTEAGNLGVERDLVSIDPDGFEAQADWENLGSPETYLGYLQARNFASPGGAEAGEPRTYIAPDTLKLNHWALTGDWTVERGASVLHRAEGQIGFRFHARDAHLVMRSRTQGTPVPFRVLVDGTSPGGDHGLDVDADGHGMLVQPRLYQLVRQRGSISDRTVEITFPKPGIEAYVFTFG